MSLQSTEIDRKFLAEGRKIAFIIDNYPAHSDIENLGAVALRRLRPNTTPVAQPMDQGVIRSAKSKYRYLLIRKIIAALDQDKPVPRISVLDAMIMLTAAWDQINETTVINCFKNARICEATQQQVINDDDDPFQGLVLEVDELRGKSSDLVSENVNADEFVDFDRDIMKIDAKTSHRRHSRC